METGWQGHSKKSVVGLGRQGPRDPVHLSVWAPAWCEREVGTSLGEEVGPEEKARGLAVGETRGP